MTWIVLVLGSLAGAGATAVAIYRSTTRRARARLDAARREATAIRMAATLDAAALTRSCEVEAREQGLELRASAEKELSERVEQVARRGDRVSKRELALERDDREIVPRQDLLTRIEREAQSKGDRAKNMRKEVASLDTQVLSALEGAAGTTAEELKQQMVDGWVEQAKADAAQKLRLIDQNSADPEHGRLAKRIMGIAIQRYQGHYLTERMLSIIPLPPGFAEYLTQNSSAMLTAIEESAGVKLEVHETGEKVRIEGADGVAREIARRALQKLIKGTAPRGVEKDPKRWVEQIGSNLDREIVDLGKKAFAELEIPRAHPDIVKLVGRLNYRTSYTQNQWKHALEAAFLGGMMASELGLDVKLARRATLLHDIGKSLSHEIDGSHAVIGAEHARRLGESEIVANAIGAHHADEPPGSVYACLVAAADALSGARPGARREQAESYSTRLEDLERIGAGFRGVERAFAVQGGREVRVYVRQDEVSDVRAVQLSSEIARKISDEMTFPGQIKVTVIRQIEAVEIAS